MGDELTIDHLKYYSGLVQQDEIQTIDDVSKVMELSVGKCRELHDILFDIARRVTDTRAYKMRESIEEQLNVVSGMVRGVGGEGMGHQDRKSVLDALNTSSKLRMELERSISIQDQDDILAAVLRVLFKVLSAVDPVVAIKVRDSCVDEFDKLVSFIPPVPGENA